MATLTNKKPKANNVEKRQKAWEKEYRKGSKGLAKLKAGQGPIAKKIRKPKDKRGGPERPSGSGPKRP